METILLPKMENKKIDIKKEYKKIIIKNEELRTSLEMLKEQEREDKKKYSSNNWLELKKSTEEERQERYKKTNEIEHNIKILELQQDLLINNLLHIQQQLLKDLMDIFLDKYKRKRIGEKTKEKIDEEFNKYILDNYNIDVYGYIRSDLNYNGDEKIEIRIQLKDFYYCYPLKNEKIIFYYTDDKVKLYYYNDANYIDLNKIEKEATKIFNNYQKSMEQLKELEAKQDKIRETNNANIPQILENYRIKKDCYY